MNDSLLWLIDLVAGMDPLLRTLLAGVGMLLETSVLIGLVVPGDTIVLIASTGVQSPFQYFGLVLAVVVGSLAGESIGFALGHYLGPRIQTSWLGRRIGDENWTKAQRYVVRRGGIAVFLSRFLPVFHSLIPVTVGVSPMRYRRFMIWSTPACIIWAFAYVSAGSAAAQGYRDLAGQLHYAGFLFVAAIVVFLLIAFGIKKLLNRIEARHMRALDLVAGDTASTPSAAGAGSATGGAVDDTGHEGAADDPTEKRD